MTPRRLLTQYSFQSFFRNEAMSEAGVDAYRAWLISVGIALVCFHFHFARVLARKYGFLAKMNDPTLFRSATVADEIFYLSASFVFISLIATLQWQSLFPGDRDFQVLSPLPIRRADIFLARISALAMFLVLFLLAFNIPPGLLFPFLARQQNGWAFLLCGFGASLQAFFSVLALQGICLTFLPYRFRFKISFFIQATLLVAAIALIPIVWHMPGLHRLFDTRAEWLTWIPTVWWMGVSETLNGSADPWHHAMAQRAYVMLATAIGIGVISYLNLYRRFSDFAAPALPANSGPSRLLWLARRDDSAMSAFLLWTLARSAQHRLILSAIAAVGASLALDGFISTYIRQWTRGRDSQGLFVETALALPLLLTFSLSAALRMSYRIPHEWRANWIFKLTENGPSRPDQLEAAVTTTYWLAVVPATLIAIPFQLVALGPLKAAAAIPILLLINVCLVEYSLRDWQRLPFTSTYSPSHTPAAISFILFLVAFSIYGYGGAGVVGRIIRAPLPTVIAIAVLAFVWRILRRKRRGHWGFEPYSFSDDGDPAVQVTNFAPE